MAGSPYASALGRLKPEFPSFLSRGTFRTLLGARDANDLAKLLESTPYGSAIARARATNSGASLVEIALNRTLAERNHHAYEATPFAGRSVVQAYLARWDIQNIELVLSSKAQGRPVTETEDHLVSDREIPAGFYSGVMGLDDFRILLGQPTVEATVTALVRYGYGTILLPLLEEFQRTRDIFPILRALDKDYFQRALAAARFFQGDEWVVRGMLQSEIDVRNALALLGGKSVDLALDDVLRRWLEGGTLLASQAPDLYAARNLRDLAARLATRWPSLAEKQGGEEGAVESLSDLEVALEKDRAASELKRLAAYPLSLGVIFTYLLRAELEWRDLRRVVFGRVYDLPAAQIEPLLISYRLEAGAS
jgi:V/A-type H+/Na+-transporting ATPase subunit C